MKLFETKYRILPVYAKNSLTGYMVYFKLWWFRVWFPAVIDELTNSEDSEDFPEIKSNRSAFFRTYEEAVSYINYRQTLISKPNEKVQTSKNSAGKTDAA